MSYAAGRHEKFTRHGTSILKVCPECKFVTPLRVCPACDKKSPTLTKAYITMRAESCSVAGKAYNKKGLPLWLVLEASPKHPEEIMP